ncbi:MAG TPA: hypothetical protein VIX59_09375 [Candidatus Binataceae bacterium]
MHKAALILALVATAALGCDRRAAPAAAKGGGGGPGPVAGYVGSNNISALSMFGSVEVRQVAGLCAGRTRLEQGSATVNDACFTGETNVVLCTDTTAANPLRCTPTRGALSIAGADGDLISYARVR